MQVTADRLRRIAADYQPYAKEPLTAEMTADDVMLIGSEIACLRLAHNRGYPRKVARVYFSHSMNAWIYSFPHGLSDLTFTE